ncbi:MAG TPA: S8 family serine peptidase [Gaiellaceae bacterium]|nr:S8 family serine peptidase [Gaiellaceae bacterium]
MHRRSELYLAAIAVVAVLIAVQGGGEHVQSKAPATTWEGLVGDVHPEVSTGQRVIVVLKAPSVAQHLEKVGFATESAERTWTTQALAAQQEVLALLAAHGLGVRPDFNYARVLDGFSASLDPRAVALLQRDPEIQGIYPVRAAFPTTLSTTAVTGEVANAGISLPGFDGRGVTIALLDTGVDASQPYLRGRVAPGIDIVDPAGHADAEPSPQDPAAREQHGTELAGLLVGAGGPDGLHGVAPAASVLPIRVAGWQPDAAGRDVVYARSDQLIAGLDRAGDPNGDGDTHDAARVAVSGVTDPYAGFADGPEALAVAGARALDTLVVVPAGNDGVAGPSFGSLAGPAGAPAALTVAAGNSHAPAASVRVVMRRGLQVEFDGELPLLGTATPHRHAELAVGAAGAKAKLFDGQGLSLVAGRAALVPAGDDPDAAALAAVHAGAAAVLLYGRRLPAGPLTVSTALDVPVVGVPAGAAQELLAAQKRGSSVGVSLGPARAAKSSGSGLASFSSRGLAFDGRLKPDLTAPGVGLATSEPGQAEGGAPQFAVVNGTSAAAAAVGGAAALLAQARPALDAEALGSLLAGYAHPFGATSLTAQGAGELDLGASLAGELAAAPTSLGFGRWSGPRWRSTQTLVVHNVSTRRLRVSVEVAAGSESESLQFKVTPTHALLAAGAELRVTVTARATSPPPKAELATGVVEVEPDGSEVLRVPWAIDFSHAPATLLPKVKLRQTAFKPSDTNPAVLDVQAGSVAQASGVQIEPVARLDILLYDARGNFIGLLAREQDLLPGSYSFGITGRGPGGGVLHPGAYELRLAAWSTLPGRPSRALVRFQIE